MNWKTWSINTWLKRHEYQKLDGLDLQYFDLVRSLWVEFHSKVENFSKYAVIGGIIHEELLNLKEYKLWYRRLLALKTLENYRLSKESIENTWKQLETDYEDMFNTNWADYKRVVNSILKNKLLREYNIVDKKNPARPTNDLIDESLIALYRMFPKTDRHGEQKYIYTEIAECMKIFTQYNPNRVPNGQQSIPLTRDAVRHRIDRIQYPIGKTNRANRVNRNIKKHLEDYYERRNETLQLLKKGMKGRIVKRGSLMSLINKNM